MEAKEEFTGEAEWGCHPVCVQEMEMRLISVKYAIISGTEHKQVHPVCVCVYAHANVCVQVRVLQHKRQRVK